MARRVFFHVGTLKTGTTYLQRVLWHNRTVLAEVGVLFAGQYFNDRVHATNTIRGMRQPSERAASAWQRIIDEVRDFDGDVIISHEFFGSASEEQAARALRDVAPAEVHLVCTARDLSRVLPTFWQEQVKFRYAGRFGDYEPEPATAPPSHHWSWRTIDAADVLRRWSVGVPPDRVHVVTVPTAGAPRDLLWRRFAAACGFDPSIADLDIPPVNESMGLVETELLRRVNGRLGEEIRGPREVPTWVRSYLGLRILAPRKGERLELDAARAVKLRERSVAIVEQLRTAGYDVVGDLDELVGPEQPATVRSPDDASDAELLDVALDVIARMLSDYRKVCRERDRLRRRLQGVHGADGSDRNDAPRVTRALRRRLGQIKRAPTRLRRSFSA